MSCDCSDKTEQEREQPCVQGHLTCMNDLWPASLTWRKGQRSNLRAYLESSGPLSYIEGGLYLNWELRNGVFSLRNWDEYDWELRIDPSWDWEIRILAWESEPEDVEKWERHFILRIEKVLFDLFIWEKYEPFFNEFNILVCALRSKSHIRYTYIQLLSIGISILR